MHTSSPYIRCSLCTLLITIPTLAGCTALQNSPGHAKSTGNSAVTWKITSTKGESPDTVLPNQRMLVATITDSNGSTNLANGQLLHFAVTDGNTLCGNGASQNDDCVPGGAITNDENDRFIFASSTLVCGEPTEPNEESGEDIESTEEAEPGSSGAAVGSESSDPSNPGSATTCTAEVTYTFRTAVARTMQLVVLDENGNALLVSPPLTLNLAQDQAETSSDSPTE